MAEDREKIRVSFRVSSEASDAFAVVSVKGREALNELYVFDIVFSSTVTDLDLDRTLAARPELTLYPPGRQPLVYHGTLAALEYLHQHQDRAYYRAKLTPRLWLLTQLQGHRVHLDRGVRDFVADTLKDGGLDDGDFEFRLFQEYPARPLVCQYHETHFDFVSRWLEYYGLCFFFEQGPDQEKMIVTDTRLAHQYLPGWETVLYAPPEDLIQPADSPTVGYFVERRQAGPGAVMVKDYNYQRPGLDLLSRSSEPSDGEGLVYLYGEDFPDPDQGRLLVRVRNEEMRIQQAHYQGVGGACGLRPGCLFKLEGHFRPELDHDYLTASVEHRYQAEGAWSGATDDGNGRTGYHNIFSAINIERQYRPQRRTRWPRINGLLPARIDATGSGQYAELDAQGRYKVKLAFDRQSRPGGKNSPPIRMIQPYQGQNWGIHFPLHKDAEVMICFVDGNPDRPVIVGAAPNPETPSVVTERNRTQALLTTAGQNQFHINDRENHNRVHLRTPHQNTHLRLGAGEDDPDGIVMKTQGHRRVTVGKSDFQQVSGRYRETIGGDQTQTVGGDHVLKVKGDAKHVFQSGYDHKVVGDQVRMNTGPITLVTPKATDTYGKRTVTADDVHLTTTSPASRNSDSLEVKIKATDSVSLNFITSWGLTGFSHKNTLFSLEYDTLSTGLTLAAAKVYIGFCINLYLTRKDTTGLDFGIQLLKLGYCKNKVEMMAGKSDNCLDNWLNKGKDNESDGIKNTNSGSKNDVAAKTDVD
jgi:type VI secretion system secreted protein VgrG